MIILQSACQVWVTPGYVFRPLRDEFGLTTDVCAHWLTAKLPNYIAPPWHFPEGPLTRQDLANADGLSQPWGGRNWLNPPYTAKGPFKQENWLRKAKSECHDHGRLTVALVPSRTGSRSWARHIWDGATEVRFVQGRIVFQLVGWTGEWAGSPGRWLPVPAPAQAKANATFDAAIVIWDPRKVGRYGALTLPSVSTWRPQRAYVRSEL